MKQKQLQIIFVSFHLKLVQHMVDISVDPFVHVLLDRSNKDDNMVVKIHILFHDKALHNKHLNLLTLLKLVSNLYTIVQEVIDIVPILMPKTNRFNQNFASICIYLIKFD